MKTKNLKFGILGVLLIASIFLKAQNINVEQRLQGIDQKIEKILKDWNVPGCGIGIVYKDKLVFAKGYGYRNLEKKTACNAQYLISNCFQYKIVYRYNYWFFS